METSLSPTSNTTQVATSILRVIKRHQPDTFAPAPVNYDDSKITAAIKKAFIAVEGKQV